MDKLTANENVNALQENMKFCQHCGGKISATAAYCTHCGAKVAQAVQREQPQITVYNTNTTVSGNDLVAVREKNKWVAFLLCLFLGCFGAHKFYEGRIGMGILYLLTFGLFYLGWLCDCIILLLKPNPYTVG